MVELKETIDYVWLFAVAAGLGAVGGLAFELLQARGEQTGVIELPAARGRGYRDLGVFANIFLGAVAAVAALWAFPPEVTTTVTQGGTTTTTTKYGLIAVVGLSLIVGSAGSSFLSALQARAQARLKEQEAAATRRVAEEQIRTLESHVEAGAPAERLTGTLQAARAAIAATEPAA